MRGYDPVAMDNTARVLPEIQMCGDPYALAEGADALIIATPWNEFKQLDMARICKLMRIPNLMDGRNLYDPDEMRALGFTYRAVGRGFEGKGVHHNGVNGSR